MVYPDIEVEILIAAYDAERTIEACIESIFLDTRGVKFRVLLFDDGSRDKTCQIVEAMKDERIRIIRNAGRVGLPGALNHLVSVSTAPFLARMDADDLMMNNRLATQLNFLKNNSDVDVCGTFAQARSGTPGTLLTRPLGHKRCVEFLSRSTPFLHPTVLARRHFFVDNAYSNAFLRAQDWELFSRTIQAYRFANIPIVGLDYEVSAGLSISGLKYKLWAGILAAVRTRRPAGLFMVVSDVSRNLLSLIYKQCGRRLRRAWMF